MKAARYYGSRDVRIEHIEEPVPAKGQAKVKIAWNGICGSDLHAYLSTIPTLPTATVPNSLTGETLPITLGHEFSGTIVGLGSDVDEAKWSIGKNVVVEPLISCRDVNTCSLCASGSRNICPHAGFIGISGWGGGLAEYIAVDVRQLHILPDGIPRKLEVGACIEPLSVAWHSVKTSGFTKGQSVLILGAGPIGLFLLKVLRAIDPSAMVMMSEPASIRREIASKHGATRVLDPMRSDVPQEAAKATRGLGVDFVFDAAGVQASIDAATRSVRPRGTIVNVALWGKKAVVDMNLVVFKEIYLTGTNAYDRVHPEVLEAVASGKITGIEDLVTRKIAIEDLVDKGILALVNEKDAHVKILVKL